MPTPSKPPNLSKTFRDFWRRPRVEAVRSISFAIPAGQVFGLLGPNGSGKSTTIKMILGLLFPTAGTLEVLGASPRSTAVKSRIGYLPEESYLYPHLTPLETLAFYARLFRLPAAEARARIDQLLDMIGLAHARHRPVGEFSKGMARRIGLAQALLNDPDLVILDEPTAGLDPQGTRQVKDLILALAARGKTVLLDRRFSLLVTTVYLFRIVGFDFIPRDDQSEFEVAIILPEGYTLTHADAMFAEIEGRLAKLRGVTRVFSTIGDTTGRMTRGQGDVTSGTIYARLVDLEQRTRPWWHWKFWYLGITQHPENDPRYFTQFEVQREARKIMEDYPELRSAVQDSAVVAGAGFRQAMIDLNLRGSDLNRLNAYSRDVLQWMRQDPEYGFLAADVPVAENPGVPLRVVRRNGPAARRTPAGRHPDLRRRPARAERRSDRPAAAWPARRRPYRTADHSGRTGPNTAADPRRQLVLRRLRHQPVTA